jgi:hypothetical protein
MPLNHLLERPRVSGRRDVPGLQVAIHPGLARH